MVEIGIHLFMALYGLSVFLETPTAMRKGRKRYIAASFAITALAALSASLEMARYFQIIFNSTSPSHWRQLVQPDGDNWKYVVVNTDVALIIMLGDALLVYRCYVVCVEYWWIVILPMLTSVSALGVIGILIESAAPLTVLGIVAAILQHLTGSRLRNTSGYVVCRSLFDGLFYSFCAIAPHMIIFRVTTGRSFTEFPSPKDGVPSGSLQFAHQTAESSFLQSTLNREIGRNRHPDTEQGQLDLPNQTPEKRDSGEDYEKT
ncbi:hypothetical protein MD484_g5205, partial [Candolleomyces efflorescens]